MANYARPIARNNSTEFFKELYRWIGDRIFDIPLHPDIKIDVVKWLKTYEV